jgi:L-ribulokinase
MSNAFAVGVDFGTNSVRALIVDCSNGQEAGSEVFDYPSGHQGVLLDTRDHNSARQNPADYLLGLEKVITGAIRKATRIPSFSPDKVIAIGVDTTGSTPIPVDKHNKPLALDPVWRKNVDAQAWLWKDHTAAEKAEKITALAAKHRPKYLAKIGGTYSSEWFWSKLWHCLTTAPDVFSAAASWVECADYIPSVLAGITDPKQIKRGICAAGHKAMYSDDWGGWPDKKFLAMMSPKVAAVRDTLGAKAYTAESRAGTLCREWARILGLPANIPIAIGALDAHYGAVGSGVKPGVLVKIIGTSSCDCAVSPLSKSVKDIPGICGIVKGSILPKYYGIEAGQSAVGDIFKWFVEVICKGDATLHATFTRDAALLKPGQTGLLALDWNNGNRTILVDPRLSGLLLGQTLYTSQEEIYRALIEATAFGARAILERLQAYGVTTKKVICCGGIAEKNPLLMQIYADVTGCTMQASGSGQACALGSAVAAAVIAGKTAGGYDSFEVAQERMTSSKTVQYNPDKANKKVYDQLYGLYMTVHDAFGGVQKKADLSSVMKDLIALKEKQLEG